MMTIIYRILCDRCVYEQLGADCLKRQNAERVQQYQIKRPRAMGHTVTGPPAVLAA